MIEKYRKIIETKKIEKNMLKQQKKKIKTDLLFEKKNLDLLLTAQIVIQEVVKKTQNELKIHITDIVNLAIDSIPFDDPPDFFDIDFSVKRNQTECELFFVQNGKKIPPITGLGGGILDVTSFGLQIACWNLKKGKKCNTIILDENFKFVSSDLRDYVGEMLKKVSEKLGLQLIFVTTHNVSYNEFANKIFHVKKAHGLSEVSE